MFIIARAMLLGGFFIVAKAASMSDDLEGIVEMHMHQIKDAMVNECKVTFT
jgi:hypothetical protein